MGCPRLHRTTAVRNEPTEARRLAILRAHQILDTPPEEAFTHIVEAAAHVCKAPAAFISFVDADRQWFKARVNSDESETGLDRSFCAEAIKRPGVTIVPDTLEDPTFRSYPNVQGDPRIRFYAGAPLVVPEGAALGTLCVIDFAPRALAPWQVAALNALGRSVVAHLQERRAALALRDGERAKGELINLLAHELYGSLTPVAGYLEMLRSAADRLPAEEVELVEELDRAVSRLTGLVRDVTDLARIEGDRLRVTKAPVDLLQVARSVARAYGPAAAARGVTVEAPAPGAAVHVDADRVRLEQVLGNLLGNALKFTPAGGVVRVGAAVEGAEAVVRVRDSGPGLTPEQIGKLFERFARLDNERVAGDAYASNGLGLFISRTLVEQHGGRIWAESPGPGQGATFAFALPLPGSGAKDL